MSPGPVQEFGRAEAGAADGQLEELQALISRQARSVQPTGADGVVETAIEGVLVSCVTAETEALSPSSETVFAVIAQGGKRMTVGDRVYEYRAGQYLVASLALPSTGSHWYASKASPALGFGLVLDPTTVASVLIDTAERSTSMSRRASPSTAAPPALGVADATPELLDAVIRMLRLLDAPGDQRVLAPMVKREILWRLICGPVGETVRQLGLADSGLAHIGHAVRWITERYSESFRVEDLAKSCGMSISAFHRNFQAVTGLSPIRFQKQIRLQRARLMLLAGRDDAATIGHRVGYDSASQFSREYRRHFGLPPGRDAERLRAESALS